MSMRSLMKDLKKLGFRKVRVIPLGFEDDVKRIRAELGREITAWDLVKGDKDKFPKIDERFVVRYIGYFHGWHFYFIGKRRSPHPSPPPQVGEGEKGLASPQVGEGENKRKEKLDSPFSPSPSFLEEGGEKQRNSKVPFSPEERAKWGKRWEMEE